MIAHMHSRTNLIASGFGEANSMKSYEIIGQQAMATPFSGHIELILGPMFSGKSTELLRRMRRFSVARMNCLLVKYKHDTRYSVQEVATHDRFD